MSPSASNVNIDAASAQQYPTAHWPWPVGQQWHSALCNLRSPINTVWLPVEGGLNMPSQHQPQSSNRNPIMHCRTPAARHCRVRRKYRLHVHRQGAILTAQALHSTDSNLIHHTNAIQCG
ncbi:hypothetical protein COCSUDRAFT_33163 [Coccomyxa subellipsoidea C-169]|uniref:Uncharacterized protein n=1 Tax=Coccomyxa subellipsoidea (strain C-169) TaxID=574566 RepID=I0YZ58_COCSC|nr:hypothetical protein COCSUDRAFT_33163 [Coccomyxa subellipsoidea C-169]EIE23677.1 hypothetical protein COCSUDRAFT_33163 [Coccomyxa subellipsoidea C-169]|eukprot:XP_005648221.1 hypothetical protein COCSUDRAFT_33163 [Coccomyxa subellipsoidea C-169]